MSATIVIRPLGPTYALSVAATQHANVTIAPLGTDQCNFAAFTNVGTTDICVAFTAPGATNPTLVFPVDGTPTTINSFVLPHGMTGATVEAVPNFGAAGFGITAIGSGAGPSILYVTPVGDQS